MATSGSRWTEDEHESLLMQIVEVQWKVDISDTYAMGNLVLGASNSLTKEFGRTVTREDVVTEILHLRDRFANFLRYCGLPGVSYNPFTNEVRVCKEEYTAGSRKETWRMLSYRLRGEECFRDLKAVFIFGRVDVADFDWVLRSFTDYEGISLPGDNPWPIHRVGIAEELDLDGLTF